MESANETPWEQYTRRIADSSPFLFQKFCGGVNLEEELTIADLQAAKKR